MRPASDPFDATTLSMATTVGKTPSDGRIPGYAGYVRGLQHVAGRPFGRATRRALRKEPVALALSETIPGEPQSNTKIPSHDTNDALVPNYTGYVPQSAFVCGKRYGAMTAECGAYHVKGGTMHKQGRKTLNRQYLGTL